MLEAFLRLFSGDKPSSVVWTADLSYWLSAQQDMGSANKVWETEEGYLQLHADLDVMPYYYYDKFWVAEAHYDASVQCSLTRTGDRSEFTLHTPYGELREISVYMPDSHCQGVVKYMVETKADLDLLLYILEHRQLIPAHLEDYPSRRAMWAKYDGLPCLGLPRSPLSAFTYEWSGLQNMALLMHDCKERVCQALMMMEAQESPILDSICKLAPPVVHFPDNLASENFTGYYDTHMRERHRKRLDQLHASGVKAAVHLDGAVRGLLPKLTEVGFDAIEALTPQPAGDLTVAEMAAITANRNVILWGGVPGIMFAPPYTWDDMKMHVQKVINSWQDRPFILGVADQVPPDGDIRFCRKISELVGGL